jgi:hypothetical protein
MPNIVGINDIEYDISNSIIYILNREINYQKYLYKDVPINDRITEFERIYNVKPNYIITKFNNKNTEKYQKNSLHINDINNVECWIHCHNTLNYTSAYIYCDRKPFTFIPYILYGSNDKSKLFHQYSVVQNDFKLLLF